MAHSRLALSLAEHALPLPEDLALGRKIAPCTKNG